MIFTRGTYGGNLFSFVFREYLCRLLTVFSVVFMILFFCRFEASAAEATLVWNDNNQTGAVAGYIAYCGTSSGNYTMVQDVKNQTQSVFSGLQEGGVYYFSVKAYDASGNESDYSTELVYAVPVTSTNTDTDGDGITDADETNIYGTDPAVADTDHDGINDGDELAFWGNTWNQDIDGDSLINLLDADSDNDSFTDGAEVSFGSDPADGSVQPKSTQTVIRIEAESGNIGSPMAAGQDTEASGGAYIQVPDGYKRINDPSDVQAGYAEYTFDVPETGEYVIWGRVSAADTASDSFYVQVDGGDPVTWHVAMANTWTWDTVSIRKVNDPRDPSNPNLYYLDKGRHTLVVKQREDQTGLDQIVITNDLEYDPAVTEATVSIEAESGTMVAPMTIAADADASNGAFIEVPDGFGKSDDPYGNVGYAEYTIDVPVAGDYVIWGRVLANGGGDDSLYIQVDGGDSITWHVANSTGWIWDPVSIREVSASRDDSNPNLYYLEKGQHTLVVRYREDATRLDRLVITNDLNQNPGN